MNSLNDLALGDWKAEWSAAFTRPEDLLAHLGLPLDLSPQHREAARRFAFRVPAAFAARMRRGDADDPLLRQVLPLGDELLELPGFLADPVGDLAAAAVPGLLHKYQSRALLIATAACAVNCRYCFRREFPYGEAQLSRRREAQALAHIAADASLHEIILSGGDPLALDDERLAALVGGLAAIPHLRRLRIHTRLPIVLPARVTAGLAQILATTRLKPVLVIHANHAQEFDDAVRFALDRLRGAGVALLNQSVLLRGVNDSVDALAALSETLFDHGVTPYYLHLLDKARGTAHFDLAEAQALALYDGLRRRLPGYLVPRLVREIAGEPYKTLV
ncbi:MAG: EF-P beta-lysylation protein EpmB [Candidatus Methylumidiphilus sp.]